MIDIYRNDAVMNGLKFDSHTEEKAVELFAINIMKAGEAFILNPMDKIKFRAQEKGLTFELNGEHTWRDEKIKLNLEAGPHRLRVYYLDELFDDQIIIADRNAEFIYTRYQPEPGSN